MTDDEIKQLVASNAQAIQALSRDISRLVETQQEAAKEREELRQLIKSTIRSIEAYADSAADERLELQQLIEANARAIQAYADSSTADRAQIKEAILMLTNVQQRMANMLGALDEDRPTILRKLMAIESQLDLVLENQEGESNS